MPAPSLVTVPVVVPMMLARLMLPAPPKVRPNVGPVIVSVLVMDNVPESELISLAEPKVIKPP